MGAGGLEQGPGPEPRLRRPLPAGSTPLGCYSKLVEYYRNGDLSFKYVKTFNMDEYVGECRSRLCCRLCPCPGAAGPSARQSLAVPEIHLSR